MMEVNNKLKGSVRPRRKLLKYPFYTYENEMYSEMMINLMNSLEVRRYKKDQVIARELDDCPELLFVEKGTYKVGYEINNKLFFRKCFGMCTKIGGFEICYKKRFLFYYKVSQPLHCLAIRKENFEMLIINYPLITPQMKIKFWNHYSQHVYQPLMKFKNIDIRDFNYRSDYSQVLYL